MQIASHIRPSPPLNGDVSLHVMDGPGHVEELDLDYVSWRRDELQRLCLTCHDPAGNVVTVRIRESVIEDIMFPGNQLYRASTPLDWGDETKS